AGPPSNSLAGQVATLQAQVATLQGQVSKLNGNITAADLVGTYTMVGLGSAIRDATGHPAAVGLGAVLGTVTLNIDGTGSITSSASGSSLRLNGILIDSSGNSQTDFTWTYANGTVSTSLTASQTGTVNFNVGPGGRVVVGASANFDDPVG